MRKNCSSYQEKLLKLEAQNLEFAKFLRSAEQFIQNRERSVQFLKQNAFLTCFWRFLRSMRILERVQPFLPHLNFEIFFGFYLIKLGGKKKIKISIFE